MVAIYYCGDAVSINTLKMQQCLQSVLKCMLHLCMHLQSLIYIKVLINKNETYDKSKLIHSFYDVIQFDNTVVIKCRVYTYSLDSVQCIQCTVYTVYSVYSVQCIQCTVYTV